MTRVGKLDRETLVRDVLSQFKTRRKELLLGPVFGVDVAVIRCPSGYLITSTDPITGEVDDIGWYSVHVSCNDVATSGNRPQFVETVIMMGENEGDERASEISRGIARAAKQVDVDVVGGHTERTAGLDHSIVVTTAFAFAEGYVTAAGAKEGDSVVLTKTAGVEGTSILASIHERKLSALPRRTLNEGKRMSRQLSVVDEGEAAFKEGGVHAMHDPTEGGVLGGLYEMGVGSGLGFTIQESKIPLAECTKDIARELGVDPLRLIASGSMLMAVEPRRVAGVLRAVKAVGVDAAVVGSFGGDERVLVKRDGRREKVDETVLDELWRIVEDGGQRPKRR
jgi:hydrogenase expression/formation protein HypE